MTPALGQEAIVVLLRSKGERAMVREIERIVDQLQLAYNGDAWYGPSERAALAGVDAHQAAARHEPTAHTISEDRIGDVRDRALGSGVSRYVTLHGLIQHHVYHVGQISLLKKSLNRQPR